MGLGISLPVLVTQIVSFLILFGLLSFLVYKPLLKLLDERAKKVKESLAEAEAVRDQSLHAEDEIKKKIQEASQQGQEIIARATQINEEIRAKAQEQAKQDAEILIARARQAINAERDGAIDELRQEFAELTILAASKVIGESLDKEAHRALIDKVLKEAKL